MNMVQVTIDNVQVEVPETYTILEAARKAGVDIPTLCYLKGVNEVGACRVCLVEIVGGRALAAACVNPVTDGMVVKTNSNRVRSTRRSTLEMILSDHNKDCLSCIRNKNCELQDLCDRYNIRDFSYEGEKSPSTYDDLSDSLVRDSSKCIQCGRCVAACEQQSIGVLSFINRGFNTAVGPAYDISMADAPCVYCGQCIIACPVGALHEKEDDERVWQAINDPTKHVVVQVAPAVRAALGEEFGYPIGTRVTGKMFAALRRMGFDKIYDTNFGADLTIMEEGTELLNRLKNGGKLPMITSCSPGWVRFSEFYFPEFLDNLSTCKSPHQMEGAIIKTYYAERKGIDPNDIFVVSIMPCTSKKTESTREEMFNPKTGVRDVDAVLTTRELARMIKQAGINFTRMPDEGPDQDMIGDYTGAGAIFGATGGVMEAALRTVADILEEKDMPEIDYTMVRGVDAMIKEAELEIAGMKLRIAVAHSTAAARKLLEAIRAGTAPDYHFIEIMGCSGGCVCGGGQPQIHAQDLMDIDVRAERAKALYEEDLTRTERKSHKNADVQKLYDDFLGQPNGHLSHELLHTTYQAREVYPDSVLKKRS